MTQENPQQENTEIPPQKTASKSGHGVVSAYLPGLTDEQNKTRMEQLKKRVTDLGFKFQVMDGSWRGVPEKSLLIQDIPEDIMQNLAQEFSQEAIVSGDKMVSTRLGTSGFGHDAWRGGFYPRGMHQRDHLAFYAKKFSAVEITSTRHSMPTSRVVMGWASSSPSGFVFAVCAPDAVRPSRMAECGADIMRLFYRRLSPLKSKLGPIVLRIPAAEPYEPGKAAAFFDALPPHQYAVQVESSAWQNQEVLDEMIKRGIVVVDTEFGCAATDSLGWSYRRLPPAAIPYISKLANGRNSYVFIMDKTSAFPSKDLMQALRDLGLTLGPDGLTMLPYHGPHDPATGAENSALPSSGYDDERGQPLTVLKPTERDDELDYFGKKQPLSPLAQYPDMDANDGASDPLTGMVDGDTRKI